MSSRLDDPHVYLPDLFVAHASHSREREAVVCGSVRRSWGEFSARINRIANALRADGIGNGQQVATLMGNSVEMLEVLFGVVASGACVVPLSGLLTGEQLTRLLEDCEAERVFVSSEFRERIEPARDGATKVPKDGWIGTDFDEPGWTPLVAFVADASTSQPPVRYALTDRFNIIYSSGTTGLPKGIVQTHRARLHWAFSNAVEMGFTATSRALTTTALYSNGTWLMMLPVLFSGGTLHVMPAFDPDAFLSTVERERITHTFMVPAQYLMVLAHPELERADLSSLETVLSAGSPLRRDTKEEVIRRISPGLFELYGFSEGFATLLKPHQHQAKFDSVGTPVLGFEMRIVQDDGKVCPPGTPGEIAGYGAGLMEEYHRRPEETEKLIWRDERGRTFVRSGDIGVVDEDGFLRLLDRKKDMIISGGFNVFPTDVETVVGQHPAVADVTVIGIPDEKWGEAALALVIPLDGHDTGHDAAAIRDWANERLAKHQRLAAVEFRNDFPRNALGKVLKRLLREPYWAGVSRNV